MRNRFVQVIRRMAAYGGYLPFCYVPVELRNGNLYPLCHEEAFNLKHGFSAPEAAWKIIDAIEEREREVTIK